VEQFWSAAIDELKIICLSLQNSWLVLDRLKPSFAVILVDYFIFRTMPKV
jgi:hypothetical protein